MITGLNTKKNTYAFGMPMPGRSYQSSNSYRYGFNGKENDLESGTQDYGMRIYNPALGKFLSVDPLTKGYPSWSPYPFAMNRPIEGVDVDGLEFLNKTKALVAFSYGYGGVVLKVENFNDKQKEIWQEMTENMSNWYGNIGASPLLSKVSLLVGEEEAPDNEGEGTSSTEAQTNILPKPKTSSFDAKNFKKRQISNSYPKYKNSGAENSQKLNNGVSLLSNATKLYGYIKEVNEDINWAIVIQTSEVQSAFTKRTLQVVQAAIDRGVIKPEHQTNETLFAIMNYVLQGDAYGNKIAENIAKNIIKIYGVPVQDIGAPSATPKPLSTSTGCTTATPSTKSENDSNSGSYQNARFLD